jgi:hypothetical protein
MEVVLMRDNKNNLEKPKPGGGGLDPWGTRSVSQAFVLVLGAIQSA